MENPVRSLMWVLMIVTTAILAASDVPVTHMIPSAVGSADGAFLADHALGLLALVMVVGAILLTGLWLGPRDPTDA